MDIHYNIILEDTYYWLGTNDDPMDTKKWINDDNYGNLNTQTYSALITATPLFLSESVALETLMSVPYTTEHNKISHYFAVPRHTHFTTTYITSQESRGNP